MEQMSKDNKKDFYIVGIGASAGGLEALETFFSKMPADSDMAFVVVQHLSSDYKSLMVEILSKHTLMDIYQVEDGMEVHPNSIYVITPGKNMTIFHNKLYLTDKEPYGINLPIDIFFKSLADERGERAIGIILSGTGSDGTRGIKAIKEADGTVVVQDEISAKFDGMPRSAIATGFADYILAPDKMPAELMRFIKHPSALLGNRLSNELIISDTDSYNKILVAIRNYIGVDFTFYKRNTIIRRIERRMNINQIEKLRDYAEYVNQSSSEANKLYKEILIGVTKFFRDAESFEVLKKEVLPKIFESKNPGEPVRVWIAGCSTGEEAYSIAIIFNEYMLENKLNNEVKIFATDIDQSSIEFASIGNYSESIVADIMPERLNKFFIRKGDTYYVHRSIREMIVFACHNLLKDPPFTRIDLISCRNVLIYFQSVLQKKVLSLFHFSLNTNGYLLLGSSESIGDLQNMFAVHDSKHKIFQYFGAPKQSLNDNLSLPNYKGPAQSQKTIDYRGYKSVTNQRVFENINRELMQEFVPPCVVIDDEREVVSVMGDVNRFLKLPTNELSLNIMKMTNKDLSVILHTGLIKVAKDKKEILYKDVVINEGGQQLKFNLLLRSYFDLQRQKTFIIILFMDVEQGKTVYEQVEKYGLEDYASQRLRDMEQELKYTKENLQATIEELETSNEELQATNEELLSSNEELQSTNEELQSVNEELYTVNSEYQKKISELTSLNNDINNLLRCTNIGTIFLDSNLRIRKFTPAVKGEMNLIETDIGRPIHHMAHNLKYSSMLEDVVSVLNSLSSLEREVESLSGKWFLVRILPYRTMEGAAEGIVITLVDISELKKANEKIRQIYYAVDKSPSCFLITDKKGNIEYVNGKFEQLTGYSCEEVTGLNPRILKSGFTSSQEYSNMWKQITTGSKWQGVLRNKTKNGSCYWEEAAIYPIRDEEGHITNYVKLAEEIIDNQDKLYQLNKCSEDLESK